MNGAAWLRQVVGVMLPRERITGWKKARSIINNLMATALSSLLSHFFLARSDSFFFHRHQQKKFTTDEAT
jgi:hypothetical protein